MLPLHVFCNVLTRVSCAKFYLGTSLCPSGRVSSATPSQEPFRSLEPWSQACTLLAVMLLQQPLLASIPATSLSSAASFSSSSPANQNQGISAYKSDTAA